MRLKVAFPSALTSFFNGPTGVLVEADSDGHAVIDTDTVDWPSMQAVGITILERDPAPATSL
jgi:hypothetical protein